MLIVMDRHTKLLLIQGDIAQLKVDAIVKDTDGPVYTDGQHEEALQLRNAYRKALQMAVTNNAKSIAFPNISTGSSGYPKDEAAEVALTTVRNFVEEQPGMFSEIIFVCWDSENYHLYKKMMGSENRVL
jgi:O-acetyl-ADP-ribose deacetylase